MISYRRSDSKAASNRLAETFRDTVGHEVFIDSHLQAGVVQVQPTAEWISQ